MTDTRPARELGEIIRQRIPTVTVYEVPVLPGTRIPDPTKRGPDKQVPRQNWQNAADALDELVRRAEALAAMTAEGAKQ